MIKNKNIENKSIKNKNIENKSIKNKNIENKNIINKFNKQYRLEEKNNYKKQNSLIKRNILKKENNLKDCIKEYIEDEKTKQINSSKLFQINLKNKEDQLRIKKIKKASWIGIIGNGVLAVSKIVIGFISGSFAVIGDGIDSSSDILTSIITLFTSKIISRPPDKEHPYGYFRAETISTSILAMIIIIMGFQLFYESILKIIKSSTIEMPSLLAIYITIISIIGKILLAYSQISTGKRINSSMLIANGKNMQNDVIISSSILAGLVIIHIFKLPVLDRIIASFVGAYIIYTGVKIFEETIHELMDGNTDKEIYNKIITIVKSVKCVINPHRIRVRKLANLYVIDLDIEVDRSFSIKEAHDISKIVEKKLKQEIDNIYDIMIHIEPEGNIEEDEKFGIQG